MQHGSPLPHASPPHTTEAVPVAERPVVHRGDDESRVDASPPLLPSGASLGPSVDASALSLLVELPPQPVGIATATASTIQALRIDGLYHAGHRNVAKGPRLVLPRLLAAVFSERHVAPLLPPADLCTIGVVGVLAPDSCALIVGQLRAPLRRSTVRIVGALAHQRCDFTLTVAHVRNAAVCHD